MGTTMAIAAMDMIDTRWVTSAPPTKSMVKRMGMNTAAVPKSGCMRMMRTGTRVRSAGITSSRRFLISRSRISRYLLRMTTSPSFMNSEGCMEKIPKFSQARVLRMGVPKMAVTISMKRKNPYTYSE